MTCCVHQATAIANTKENSIRMRVSFVFYYFPICFSLSKGCQKHIMDAVAVLRRQQERQETIHGRFVRFGKWRDIIFFTCTFPKFSSTEKKHF